MASGPEHYRKAEESLVEAEKREGGSASEWLLDHAQVHATLALAAATADPFGEAAWAEVLR
jgi:hypothetical protein